MDEACKKHSPPAIGRAFPLKCSFTRGNVHEAFYDVKQCCFYAMVHLDLWESNAREVLLVYGY